jgi:hypothetical protein
MFLRAAISPPRASLDKTYVTKPGASMPSRAFLFESPGEAGSLHPPGGGRTGRRPRPGCRLSIIRRYESARRRTAAAERSDLDLAR